MKFHPILNNNHDIKKNGYAIMRKLHKLEKKRCASVAYSRSCNEGIFVVLTCKHFAEFIKSTYDIQNGTPQYISVFIEKTDKFVQYLQCQASNGLCINKQMLAGYLKAYTKFFNRAIDKHIKCEITSETVALWNTKCLMAYTAVWGNK